MILDPLQRQARLGEHIVEALHELLLRHRGDRGEVLLPEPLGIDPTQALPVPGGSRFRDPEEMSEAAEALRGQLLTRPRHTVQMLRQELAHLLEVPLPQGVVGIATMGPSV